jgi:hypothetical protein
MAAAASIRRVIHPLITLSRGPNTRRTVCPLQVALWRLLACQMPVMLARSISDISIYDIADYTASDEHGGTPNTRRYLAKSPIRTGIKAQGNGS